ncbi:hypothetical protein [Bacillus thuringiensis]|uniref:hypothetical protein n=1 Tax=Bacillus thuringiensis TaxID=1428 RepID=UPI00159C43C4|nr:hypothetical protein [Bacillus thuringiensis]
MGDDLRIALVKAGTQQICWTMAPALTATTTFAPINKDNQCALITRQSGVQTV